MRVHSGTHINDIWKVGGPFIGPDGKPHGRVTVQAGSGDVLHTTEAAPDPGRPYTSAQVRALFNKYGFITDDEIKNAVVYQPPTESAGERLERIATELNVFLRTWSDFETSLRLLPNSVQPDTPGVGSYKTRGLPLRWFQSAADDQPETEVPNIKTILIDRSVTQDAATCTITLYNQLMGMTGEGLTGYYSPTRGDSLDGTARWGFTKGRNWTELATSIAFLPGAIPSTIPADPGAPYTDTEVRSLYGNYGFTTDPQIADATETASQRIARNAAELNAGVWHNVLVPNAILRTYQGYGGNSKTISQARTDGNLVLTGIWFIDSVTVTTDGMLQIKARDPMKLLLEQQLYPPLVPQTKYPLKYYRYQYYTQSLHAASRTVDGITYEPVFLGADAFPEGDGYWTTDGGNEVDSFGDARNHDRTGGTELNPDSAATQVRAAFGGNGYYVLNGSGQIAAFGDAGWFGDPFSGGFIAANGLNGVCIDMAVTHTGGGYWVLDNFGHVFAYGDAPSYGDMPQIFTTGVNEYNSIDSHPTNYGYWVVDQAGNVLPSGACTNVGQRSILDWNPVMSPGLNDAVCIRGTKTGNGYWILTDDGQVAAFGDATDYGQIANPQYPTDWRDKYWKLIPHTNGAANDGYLILKGDGTILNFGAAPFYGSPTPRQSAPAAAPDPAAPGSYTQQMVRDLFAWYGLVTEDQIATDTETAIQRITRILTELNDGERTWANINASLALIVSQVGSGVKRTNGNYRDYTDIVRDLVLWSGFLLYDPSMDQPSTDVPPPAPDPASPGSYTEQHVRDLFFWYGYKTDEQILAATSSPTRETAADRIARIAFELNDGARTWSALNASLAILPRPDVLPAVYGNLETTGAFSPEPLPDNMFDKKPVIDAIHQIKEVVGYFAWCDDEGAFRFESPNWWAPGNFDEFGKHLEQIPEVDEKVQLTNYSVTNDDNSLRSMVIISSEDPDVATNGSTTVTTRLIPRDAKKLRGLVKPAMWVNGFFQSRDEQRIMAELIALHLHFESRLGQLTCAANPTIGIDDQVRVFERQSNEAYIHYVRGVSTSMDLDTGQYTMQLQTNWLGTSDGWGVSTSDLFLAAGGFRLSGRCVEWLQTQSKNPIRQVLVGG